MRAIKMCLFRKQQWETWSHSCHIQRFKHGFQTHARFFQVQLGQNAKMFWFYYPYARHSSVLLFFFLSSFFLTAGCLVFSGFKRMYWIQGECSDSRRRNTQTSKSWLQSHLQNEVPTHCTPLCGSVLSCHLRSVWLTKKNIESHILQSR